MSEVYLRLTRLFIAVGAFAITAGCARDDSVGPEESPSLRRETQLDCEGSVDECAQIQRGIDYLKAHANPLCNMYGNAAQDRYDAAPGVAGFRDTARDPNDPTDDNIDMGVPLYPLPANPYTNVYPSFGPGIDDAHTGALIAHEEYHHDGGGESQALQIQAQCLNPQP